MSVVVGDKKRALFFGVHPSDRAGHYLHEVGNFRKSLDGRHDYPGFPWEPSLMDTGLLKKRKVPDHVDGRVHWTAGGTPIWIAFFWWDRSADTRGGCNSGFYVQGFDPRLQLHAAFEFACDQWPAVVARQTVKLTLWTCHCNPADRTGGGHDPKCPEFEPECTCYEMEHGHQPGCHFNLAKGP